MKSTKPTLGRAWKQWRALCTILKFQAGKKSLIKWTRINLTVQTMKLPSPKTIQLWETTLVLKNGGTDKKVDPVELNENEFNVIDNNAASNLQASYVNNYLAEIQGRLRGKKPIEYLNGTFWV